MEKLGGGAGGTYNASLGCLRYDGEAVRRVLANGI